MDGDGHFEVVADDHGVLRIYGADGTVTATDKGWPPAYTIPIAGPFGRAGETCILRASGIASASLVDRGAKPVWQTPFPTWRHYGSIAAVANIDGRGKWCAGSLAEDGNFECFDISTGAIRWTLDLHAAPNATSVAAGNLNGIRGDEFLLGLQDGRLICLTEEAGKGAIVWQKLFDAAVANPIISDIDRDGAAEVVISTSDGNVRVLSGAK